MFDKLDILAGDKQHITLQVAQLAGQSESTCSVWLEGLDLDRVTNGDGSCSHKQDDEFEAGGSSSSNKYGERWPIGAVRVTTTTLWAVLEEALTSLALHHLDTLARYVLVPLNLFGAALHWSWFSGFKMSGICSFDVHVKVTASAGIFGGDAQLISDY